MLKILGRANSINVRKVLWACDEIGIAYEREDWGRGFRPLDEPDFVALNPHKRVPVAIEGDNVLWESNTIVRYLAARSGREDLLPSNPMQRALVERWMDWQVGDFATALRITFQTLVLGMPSSPEALAASIKDWTQMMRVLDQRLGETGAFLAGPAFTVADIPVGLAVNRWFSIEMERPDLPHTAAYYERLSERPAFRAHGRNGTP